MLRKKGRLFLVALLILSLTIVIGCDIDSGGDLVIDEVENLGNITINEGEYDEEEVLEMLEEIIEEIEVTFDDGSSERARVTNWEFVDDYNKDELGDYKVKFYFSVVGEGLHSEAKATIEVVKPNVAVKFDPLPDEVQGESGMIAFYKENPWAEEALETGEFPEPVSIRLIKSYEEKDYELGVTEDGDYYIFAWTERDDGEWDWVGVYGVEHPTDMFEEDAPSPNAEVNEKDVQFVIDNFWDMDIPEYDEEDKGETEYIFDKDLLHRPDSDEGYMAFTLPEEYGFHASSSRIDFENIDEGALIMEKNAGSLPDADDYEEADQFFDAIEESLNDEDAEVLGDPNQLKIGGQPALSTRLKFDDDDFLKLFVVYLEDRYFAIEYENDSEELPGEFYYIEGTIIDSIQFNI